MPLRKEVQQIVKGTIQISDDGKNWKTTESFEFGNLKNDPTRRFHYLKQPVKAHFVRMDVNLAIGKDIREFDLF
jgi:alpha-L-fucosidase